MNTISSLLTSVRLRHGMFWPGRFPAFPWRSLFTCLACALTYGGIAYVDDLEAREQIMAERWSGQFAQCLNGTWRGVSEDGVQIACMPAEAFDPAKDKSSTGT